MGFYVPNSLSDSFVTSRRNEEGNYLYEEQKNKVGITEQQALQDLGESYSSTISNAYASYLANQRAVLGSSMGQGFKEQYLQQQQENLMTDIANANLSLSKARAEIQTNADAIRSQIDTQRVNEITNLDRAINSMQGYMDYLNSAYMITKNEAEEGVVSQRYLENATGLTYDEYKDFKVDEFYDYLTEAQPRGYYIGGDENSPAMSYYEWMRTQMKDTQADREFEKWFYGGGGYEELKEALPTVRQSDNELTSLKAYQEKLKPLQKELEETNSLIDSSTTLDKKHYREEAKKYYDNRDLESLSKLKNEVNSKHQDRKLDNDTWKINGETYKTIGGASGYLTRNDNGWKKINKELSLDQKLDNKEIFENDLIEYNGQLYIIGPYRSLIKVRKA